MIHTQILDEAGQWFVMMRDGDGDGDGGVGAAAREQFTEWLCKSPEHVRAYLELTAIWAEAASVDAERKLDAKSLIARARAEGNVVALGNVGFTPGTQQNLCSAGLGAQQRLPSEEGSGPRSIETTASSAIDLGNESSTIHWRGNVRVSGASTRMSRYHHGFLAASVICTIVGGAWWQLSRPPIYTTGIGDQRSITLEDGSRVELNARSRVRIRFSDTERYVDLLEGQGMFQVSRDPQRPFIVHSSDVRVRAVGTQFDVYLKPTGTLVTVLEGKVEVRTAASPSFSSAQDLAVEPRVETSYPRAGVDRAEKTREVQPTLRGLVAELTAGEQVIVAADQITRPPTANVTAATGWTNGQLVFDSASLEDVAHEFNRHNRRQLVIRDAQLKTFLISGVFSSTDPSSLLRFLEEQPYFTVKEMETEIQISRRE